MAGRTGAGPAAVRVDARHIVADRAFHDAQAVADLDRMFGPVVFDVGNLGHRALIAADQPPAEGSGFTRRRRRGTNRLHNSTNPLRVMISDKAATPMISG